MNLDAYRKLIRYVDHVSGKIAVKVFFLVLISFTYMVQAISCARAVNIVISSREYDGLAFCLLIVGAAVILRTLLCGYMEVMNKKLASDVKTRIRTTVFDHLTELGPKYVNDKRSGRIQSLLLDGIESLEPFLINYVPQIISFLVSGILIIGYCLFLDAVTGVVMIAILALSFAIPFFTMPLVRRSMLEYWGNYSRLNANYIEAIQGITTLKAFNASKARQEDLAREAGEFYRSQIYNTAFSVMDSGIMIALSAAAANLTVGVAAYRGGLGLVEASSLSVFLFLAAELSRPMMDLNGAWHNSFLGLSVLDDLFAILEEKPDLTDPVDKDESSLDGVFPEIELEDVSFTYPGGKKPALSHISMKIPAGSTIAVVGKSGSGKSTLANLICRFYDVDSGSIRIHHVDIRKYGMEYLRRHIGVVFQDNFLFNGTIAENIAMARPGASPEEIVRAAETAGADEFIRKLPDGYDTVIGERGIDLSGGQRQRIAIARTLLKEATILIFDEATSNVDAANEAYIKNSIDRVSDRQTTILIAHRLSTIRNADQIVFLEDGQIRETGTHEELMKAEGAYAHMVKIQTGAEK